MEYSTCRAIDPVAAQAARQSATEQRDTGMESLAPLRQACNEGDAHEGVAQRGQAAQWRCP
jgi:hypothetical protein